MQMLMSSELPPFGTIQKLMNSDPRTFIKIQMLMYYVAVDTLGVSAVQNNKEVDELRASTVH